MTNDKKCDDCGKLYKLNEYRVGWKKYSELVPVCNCRSKKIAEENYKSELRNIGIPEKFLKAEFKTYPGNSEYVKKVKKYISQDYPMTLFMSGLLGTGKTGLACCALKELMSKGSVKYKMAYPLLNEKLVDPMGTFEKYIKYQTLVIDEIGLHATTDSIRQFLESLITERHDQLKNTILISNLKVDSDPSNNIVGFRDLIGERAYDRIKQNSEYSYIKFIGDNLRSKHGDVIAGVKKAKKKIAKKTD